MTTESEYKPKTLEDLESFAEKEGCDLIVGEPDEILVDLDTGSLHEGALAFIHGSFSVNLVESWVSRNGKKHYRVQLQACLDPLVRYALGMALGSDPVRGLIGIVGILNDIPGVSSLDCLFRPKGAKVEEIDV